MEKRKASAAHMKATSKWEKKAYYKTLVRFPAALEDDIRAAAGDSVNGYIVRAVVAALEADRKTGRLAAGAAPDPDRAPMEDALIDFPED